MGLNQLQKYYGPQVNNFLRYEETVWRKESFTFADYDAHILLHQNNGHALFNQAFLNGQFL